MVEITIRTRSRTEAVLTQRKFFRKTARGKVVKGAHEKKLCLFIVSLTLNHSVIRERYLRTDVSCGIQDCIACPSSAGENLPALGDGSHSLFPDGHYILPDTNVFLAQVSFHLTADQ
jgi:exosome complex exonuclease DIS3/RRP44